MKVIARLEFELAYFKVTVQHISHYAAVVLPLPQCLKLHPIYKIDFLNHEKINLSSL